MRPKQTSAVLSFLIPCPSVCPLVVSLVCLINNQPIILLSILTRPAKTQCQRLPECRTRPSTAKTVKQAQEREGVVERAGGHATHAGPRQCLRLCGHATRHRGAINFGLQRQEIQVNAHTKDDGGEGSLLNLSKYQKGRRRQSALKAFHVPGSLSPPFSLYHSLCLFPSLSVFLSLSV